MSKKNVLKGVLDLFLVLITVLLYEKGAISLIFHEVAGLILCSLFVIHNGVNHRWVTTVTKRLFDSKLLVKTKVGYLVNILLLICWTLIGVSGIFISKVLFNFQGSMVWKLIHFSASGFALILVGVHIGLHWYFVKSLLKKGFGWLNNAEKPLGTICLIITILFGVYSVRTTDFTRWITMPFTHMTQSGGAMTGHPEGMLKDMPEDIHESNGLGSRKGKEGIKKSDFKSHDKGERTENFSGKRMEMNRGFSLINLLRVICHYTSLMILFAAIAYGLERLFERLDNSKMESKVVPKGLL